MDLTINFVWIGPAGLGWLEKFMIFSWREWKCAVNLFTHRTNTEETHDHASLGLPEGLCTIVDLPTIMATDLHDPGVQTRAVLTEWYRKALPDWNSGGKEQVYNMVDLTKSYLAMTRVGVVIDIIVGIKGKS